MLKHSRISEVAKSKIADTKAVRQWCVPSYSRPGTSHYVTLRGGSFTCTCENYRFTSKKCAHILQVLDLPSMNE